MKITLLESYVPVKVGCSVYDYCAELAVIIVAVVIENFVHITTLVKGFLLFFEFVIGVY